MASELGNQLLARVQDEMARNIATIKRQLIEWLERPESGGVEALRENMAEISGGLSLMGQTEAVALAEAIVAGVEALNQSVSEQGVNAAFAEKGAEIASGLLVLADYIERLDHISDNHKQSVAQATAAVKGLADGGEKIQVTTQPFISRETYQALANEVNTVIETSRNQIEQHIRNLDAPFNAENIIAQNEGLIQIFAILTLKTPQLLLQQANQMLAKDLSYAEWIEVAEALILVQETLKQLPETQTAPTANNYADAVQVQVAHSRQLEIEKLIRDTGKQGKGFFESLRKEVLQVETVKQEQPWADAAKQLVHYSSVAALVGLKELATPLQQLGLLFAEFTAQNDATLAQTYVPVIDALVAVEYLFNDLAEAGKISVQDIAFLTEAVGKIEKICPVSGKAKALFVELANSMPTESEDDAENTGDIQEFKDALGAGLEVLADDFSALEQEEEAPEEEELPEPTPVVLASHDTVSAAPKLAMGLAQSSAAGDNAISVRAGDDAAAPAVAPGAPAVAQAATPSPAPTVQPPVVSAETAAPQSDATTAAEAPTTPEVIAPQEATVPAGDAALAAEETAAPEATSEEPAAAETHEPEAAAEEAGALEVADEASAESAVEPAAIVLDEPPSAPASVPAAASTKGAPVGIAYFANKSLSDLERFDVPAEKMTFMGSHADAVMDEEIREFFNEELGEIVATMNEVYPQWRENPDDAQRTTDIRRAFHTLKGSGRTVGYEALGEFAWQHEQLLNRVIEKDFAANSLVRDTVGDAISLLNVLQAQDEFVEHKGALLQQALVAERVRLSLLDAPQSEQQALDALSRQLRLSDGAASATSATVSVAETATSAVDDEWAAFDDIALADESTSAASEAPAITLASEAAEPAPEETADDMSAALHDGAPQHEAPAITLAADDLTFSDSAVEPAAHETVAPASADAVAHERQEEPASIAAPAAAASDFAGQEGYDKALRTLQRGLRMGEPDADMQAALAETIRRQWQQSVADDPALREAMAQSLLASFQNEGGTQAQWVADILAQANAAGDTAVPIQPGLTAPAAPGLPPHETPHGISEQAYNRMLSTLRRGLATGADEDMQAVLSDSISRQWLQQGIATEGETRDDIIAHLKAALASEGAVDESVLDAMLAHVPQRVPSVLPEGVRQDSYGVMMETLRANLDNANSAEVQEALAAAIGNQWQNQNSLQDSAIRAAVAEQMAAVLGGNGHDNAALVEAVLNRAAEKARQAPAGLDKADYDQLLETLRDRIGEAQDAAAQEALAARISSQLHADNHLQDEATRDAIAQRVIAALGGAGETDAAAVEAILSRVAEKVAEQTPVPAALPVGVRPESYGAMLQTLSGGLATAQGDEHAAEALAATIGAQWQEQHSLQDADTRAAVAQQISAALGGETDVATVEGILNRAAVQAAALPAGVKHEAYGEMLQTLRAGIGAASGDEVAAEALAATIGAQWQEQHSLQDANTRAAVAQQISAALGGETDAATVEGILNRAAVQAAALPAGVKHEAYGEMLQTLRAGIGAASGDAAAAEALAATIGAQWQEQHSLQDADTRAAVAQQISAAL
ncbi:Hpt domain-containing protein, partial [Cardiobacterium hominis]|uniref:Hpt domain-containing protein n=1 Tax=Cardiobacterium hominis TaxID=2718 RepID=UPI0028D8544F